MGAWPCRHLGLGLQASSTVSMYVPIAASLSGRAHHLLDSQVLCSCRRSPFVMTVGSLLKILPGHGPFSSYPWFTSDWGPFWSRGHTVARMNLGERSAWALDMDLKSSSRGPQGLGHSVSSPGSPASRGTILRTARSAVCEKELSQRGRAGALGRAPQGRPAARPGWGLPAAVHRA